jgi:hypothetical protein
MTCVKSSTKTNVSCVPHSFERATSDTHTSFLLKVNYSQGSSSFRLQRVTHIHKTKLFEECSEQKKIGFTSRVFYYFDFLSAKKGTLLLWGF